MRRLVVCRIFGGNRSTVRGVVHQGIDAMRACNRSGNDINRRRILFRAHNEFFTPVTKQVCNKARSILGAIATRYTKRRRAIKVNLGLDILRIELGHVSTVQKFIVGVTVEVNAEVLRNSRRTDFFVLDSEHSTALARPHLVTAMGRIYVSSHAASVIYARVRLSRSPDNRTIMGT